MSRMKNDGTRYFFFRALGKEASNSLPAQDNQLSQNTGVVLCIAKVPRGTPDGHSFFVSILPVYLSKTGICLQTSSTP